MIRLHHFGSNAGRIGDAAESLDTRPGRAGSLAWKTQSYGS